MYVCIYVCVCLHLVSVVVVAMVIRSNEDYGKRIYR